MKKKTIISITIVALLVGGVLLSGHLVKAVSASTESSPSASSMTQIITGGAYEDLAAALGITVDELTAAQEKAFTSAVDTALDAEYITATQSETLKAGDPKFTSLYRFLTAAEKDEFDRVVFLAEALGISESELESAVKTVEQAKIDALVEEGVITQEEADLRGAYLALQQSSTFTENYKQAMTEAINAEVEAGSITQAQADLLIAQLEEMPVRFGMGIFGMNHMGRFEMRRFGMDDMEGFGGRGGRRGLGGN